MSETDVISSHLNESSRIKAGLTEQAEKIAELAKILKNAAENDGEIISCGNGGSACDAMHFAEELIARFEKNRPGIKARHLLDIGTITCWANDFDYKDIFARQIQTLCSKKDVLVVFSTSGNSANILSALNAAKETKTTSIALLGKDGGSAKTLADYSLVVDSNNTAHIQEAHIAIVHIFCRLLEKDL